MLLELVDIHRHFGGVQAVRGVSGGLDQGRILGLIGPNGSGKTTLLSVIGGSLSPTRGELRLDGKPVGRWSPAAAARAGIARAFQVPQPIVELDVLGNVAVGAMFGRRRIGRGAAEADAWRVLERVGLDGVAHRSARTLSLAERKRLELARLLAIRPRIALVDEVMGGLSRHQVDDVIAILRELRDEGVSLIVVEHVGGVVAQLADEVCVLHEGAVLAWDTPQAVMADRDVIDAYLGRRARTDA
jgi:branched-chain amino acid transport system ATP-binding protein